MLGPYGYKVNKRKLSITMPAVHIYYPWMAKRLTRPIIISITTDMKYHLVTWSEKDSFTHIKKIHTHIFSVNCSPYTATKAGGIRLQEFQYT